MKVYRAGFTLIEVLAIILVLVLGMFSAVALLRYGVQLSRDAQASALAMPTAMTILRDVHPIGVPSTEFESAGSGTWEGYVNGMWVRRKIFDQDVKGSQTFATVQVEVFWGSESSRALTLTERLTFHAR